jgi:hypothetical protein
MQLGNRKRLARNVDCDERKYGRRLDEHILFHTNNRTTPRDGNV